MCAAMRVQAQFAWAARSPAELTLARGDVVEVFEPRQDGWWLGRVVSAAAGEAGPCGIFPANYTQVLHDDGLRKPDGRPGTASLRINRRKVTPAIRQIQRQLGLRPPNETPDQRSAAASVFASTAHVDVDGDGDAYAYASADPDGRADVRASSSTTSSAAPTSPAPAPAAAESTRLRLSAELQRARSQIEGLRPMRAASPLVARTQWDTTTEAGGGADAGATDAWEEGRDAASGRAEGRAAALVHLTAARPRGPAHRRAPSFTSFSPSSAAAAAASGATPTPAAVPPEGAAAASLRAERDALAVALAAARTEAASAHAERDALAAAAAVHEREAAARRSEQADAEDFLAQVLAENAKLRDESARLKSMAETLSALVASAGEEKQEEEEEEEEEGVGGRALAAAGVVAAAEARGGAHVPGARLAGLLDEADARLAAMRVRVGGWIAGFRRPRPYTEEPFWQPVSRTQAEEMLAHAAEGTFLVRPSSHAGFLAVSFVRGEFVEQSLIGHDRRGFWCEGPEQPPRIFPTLAALLEDSGDFFRRPHRPPGVLEGVRKGRAEGGEGFAQQGAPRHQPQPEADAAAAASGNAQRGLREQLRPPPPPQQQQQQQQKRAEEEPVIYASLSEFVDFSS